jgi:hypothetical protein
VYGEKVPPECRSRRRGSTEPWYPGEALVNHRPGRAGRQDYPHHHRTLRVAGGSPLCAKVQHVAGRGSKLRAPCGPGGLASGSLMSEPESRADAQLLLRNSLPDPLDSGRYAAGFSSISHQLVAALPGLTLEFLPHIAFRGSASRLDGLPHSSPVPLPYGPALAGTMLLRNSRTLALFSASCNRRFFAICMEKQSGREASSSSVWPGQAGNVLLRNFICDPLDSRRYAAGFLQFGRFCKPLLLGLTLEAGIESLFAAWASRLDGLPRRTKFLFRMAPPTGQDAHNALFLSQRLHRFHSRGAHRG